MQKRRGECFACLCRFPWPLRSIAEREGGETRRVDPLSVLPALHGPAFLHGHTALHS